MAPDKAQRINLLHSRQLTAGTGKIGVFQIFQNMNNANE